MIVDVNLLKQLFINRFDTYLTQKSDGRYVRIDAPLTDEVLKKHLSGELTIAVYSYSPDGYCKWIAYDFDHEPRETALKMFYRLLALDPKIIDSAMLEWTGGRGYHLWIFLAKPYPLKIARRLAVELSLQTKTYNVEIFPKQSTVTGKGYGSALKLPFGVHRKTGVRSVMIYPESLQSIDRYRIPPAKYVEYHLTDMIEEDLEYRPPTPNTFSDCIAYERIRRGVSEGMRDESAFFLARYYHWIGLPKIDAYILLREWNKRNDPPLSEDEIRRKVESAYQHKYYVGKASIYRNQVLKPLCHGCNANCPGRRQEVLI